MAANRLKFVVKDNLKQNIYSALNTKYCKNVSL